MNDDERIKIEKGIPIPQQGSQNIKWPFGELEVGDSFVMKGKDKPTVASYVSYWRRKTGWGFATRRVEGGTRIWRTR